MGQCLYSIWPHYLYHTFLIEIYNCSVQLVLFVRIHVELQTAKNQRYNKLLFLIHIWISYDIIFFNIMIFYYIIIIIIILFELYHIYPILLIFYFQHSEYFRKKYIFLYFFFKSQVFYECNIIHILVNVWPWI